MNINRKQKGKVGREKTHKQKNMGLRKTSLVLLYIIFIFHLQLTFHSVSSRPSLVATNHENETLPFNATKRDVVGFEGKYRELAVVIKKGGGGGRGGGFGSSRGGGGGSSGRSRSRGGVYPGGSHSHHSSGSRNLRGEMCTVGWLGLSFLAAGLILVA